MKLEYIKGLNIQTIILSGIYDSPPGGDFGYEITNHKEINRDVGTLQDLKDLMEAAHDLGMVHI